MKKTLTSLVVSLGLLAGCSGEKPTTAVDEFLSSFQKGDFEKAGTYIEGGIDEINESAEDQEMTEAMLKEIAKKYEFEKPSEILVKDDKAEVEVKVTSVDVGSAMTSTIGEVMPVALASAFNEDSEKSEKAIEELTQKTVVKYLKSEETPMVTRTVKLNLETDKEGKYKIVADDKLQELILANIDTVEEMFGEEITEENSDQPEQSSSVIYNVEKDKSYDVNPIKMNIQEVSFKKAENVPEDEQSNIEYASEKDISSEFNYLYVKYNAENTSDEDFIFSGITEAVIFSQGKQEKLEYVPNLDFIDYDEAEDDSFYGKVNKEGEVGLVIDTDPSMVEKVRFTISSSMKDDDSYENTTDEQVVEFEIKKAK